MQGTLVKLTQHGLLDCRDEREQRISDVEYISQAVRAKAEECLAAVDDGESPQ